MTRDVVWSTGMGLILGATRRAVIEKVTQALVEAIDAPKESVRVLIHDIPRKNWGIAGTIAQAK